jgi:hypothetical protein
VRVVLLEFSAAPVRLIVELAAELLRLDAIDGTPLEGRRSGVGEESRVDDLRMRPRGDVDRLAAVTVAGGGRANLSVVVARARPI